MDEEWNDEELVEKIFVDNPPYDIEELTKEEILSDMVMDYLVSIKNPVDRIRQFEKVKDKAKELKVASSFKTIYKQKDDAIGIKNLEEKSSIGITFPNMNNITYNTTRYEIDESGAIYENVYKVGKILVCYHPILPLEIYTNLEDGSEKIKIAFYKRGNWKNIIVDKSIISNSQSIIKLSDFGIEVNSENAKFLIRYLAEMCNLNEDKIKINTSVSRLGWAKDVLIPYSDKFEFDNEKEFPNMKEKFGESGKLEEWIEFFKERRKHSSISRIVMAASVASILLKDIKQNGFTVHIWGESEYGKAQPLDTKIITPNGITLMKNIKIGDYVIGNDGKKHKVIGVFPQGRKEIYEITFVDGRKTKCCKEHLWNVSTITRRNHKKGYTVMSLEDMLKKPLKTPNGGFQYRIPLTKPVEFREQEILPIQPYLLGALIGDGCLTLKKRKDGTNDIYFNNSEEDVIKKVEIYLKEKKSYLWKNKHTNNQYVLRNCKWLKDNIQKLSLNCKSTEKFIPEIYKKASIVDRYLLLQGLFDTDGNIDQKGELKYCTKSRKLAHDVLELCFSLGYRATISNYKYRPDEYYVCISANKDVYSSKKHQNKMQSVDKKRKRIEDTESLAIKSIEKCGEEECQCIMVDSKEHTYLCDDFIVTHNTVACMVGQSIFGNPSQNDNKGIGINFNFTNAGLEYRLNLYNNIPLFVNEMQHQKDAKDYDKILFLISEGTGKSRSTKNGGIGKENSWNNIVITNGEKNIIKDNSNAGAYNRCISCEITEYSYENLSEVADFVKENYGTPIREILKHLNEYNCKQIYKNILDSLENQDITNKQKILEAIILLGDKILTDIIFKDEFYLTQKDFENKTIKKKEVAVEERAFEIVRDWYVSEKRHFLSEEGDAVSNQELKVEIYGREMKYGYLAIIPSVLKKTLEENSYDFNEVINAWKRKDYIKHEKNRNTLTVIINNSKTKCIVLDMKKDIEDETETTEEDLLPF